MRTISMMSSVSRPRRPSAEPTITRKREAFSGPTPRCTRRSFGGGFQKAFLDIAHHHCSHPTVGITIGAGTDVAVETADIILVKSNPQDVVTMIKLARATYKKMVQNLAWATGYNAVAIPLAAGVLYGFDILLSPAMGAVLMSVSTIVVAINARLLKH